MLHRAARPRHNPLVTDLFASAKIAELIEERMSQLLYEVTLAICNNLRNQGERRFVFLNNHGDGQRRRGARGHLPDFHSQTYIHCQNMQFSMRAAVQASFRRASAPAAGIKTLKKENAHNTHQNHRPLKGSSGTRGTPSSRNGVANSTFQLANDLALGVDSLV